jgi:SNF2 family DNA or RNA helicase
LKRLPGEVAWIFAESDYDVVASRLAGQIGEAAPHWLMKAWQAARGLLTESKAKKNAPVRYCQETPASVRKKIGELLPYQVEAVKFGISRGGRMLCGDDMGLGKTLIALALAFQYREEWPVLVICPAMLRWQWQEQILHWLGHSVKEDDIDVIMHGTDKVSKRQKFVIMPYSLMSRDGFQNVVGRKEFKIVICDESHYIKDHSSQRTQACVPLVQRAKRAVLLSGTPTLNNATEMHPQLQAVLGESIGTFQAFAQRYAYRKTFRFRRRRIDKWQGVKRETELGILLRALMIRRLKDEVGEQLPEKRRQRIVIDSSHQGAVGESQSLADFNQEGLSRAFQKLCDVKVKKTQEYLDVLLDNTNDKALLFAHHQVMLNVVERVLRIKKIKFIRIDGRTPMTKRPQLIRSFQGDQSIKCALLSITGCAEGVDLSAASTVVFCELYWVPGVMEQCEARAHRKGQRSMVDIQYLIVKGSIDDCAYRSLCMKKAATTAILSHSAGQVACKRPAGSIAVDSSNKRHKATR